MFGVRKAASEFADGLHEVQRETERLKVENTKLRELCAALYQCVDAGKPCKTCPLFDGDGGCMDEQRMDELGVPR